jgi:hypothetical protein
VQLYKEQIDAHRENDEENQSEVSDVCASFSCVPNSVLNFCFSVVRYSFKCSFSKIVKLKISLQDAARQRLQHEDQINQLEAMKSAADSKVLWYMCVCVCACVCVCVCMCVCVK